MKLIFLGTGSAFTLNPHNFQSNMLLESADKRLLIDCGSDARWSLFAQGLGYKDISDVYISHLHADHAGGLEWLAYQTKFDPDCSKPNLHISEMLVDTLWSNLLSAGLCSLEDVQAQLTTFFNVMPIPVGGSFTWESVDFQLIQTRHVINNSALVPSHGLFFEINKNKIFITTDTKFTPERLLKFYTLADIIFHDCEIGPKLSHVHSSYEELCTLDEKIKEKIWLYHYDSKSLPDAKKDGFRGFVKKGQTFEF